MLVAARSFGYMFNMKLKMITKMINVSMDVPVRNVKLGEDIWFTRVKIVIMLTICEN